MDGLANSFGFIYCFVGFGVLLIAKGKERWSFWILLCGAMMIFAAIMAFKSFSALPGIFDNFLNAKKINFATNHEAKSLVNIWSYAIPLILSAIGCNLVTEWVLAKKPIDNGSKNKISIET